jgi:uncharacterized protein (DUF2252 family)
MAAVTTPRRPLQPEGDVSVRGAPAGKAARRVLPREQLAECPVGDLDVVGTLGAGDSSRVPELLPLRYGRMVASPFAYYRGSAAVMATDLDRLPASGLTAQLCGDAHLSNFGIYASPERRQVFDVNDFDETLAGPFEWDVRRLAASLVLAAREAGHDDAEARASVLTGAATYRTAMRTFAGQGNLAVWYASLDVERALDRLRGGPKADLKRGRRAVQRARGRDSAQAAAKLTERVDGRLRFRNQPPLLVRLEELVPEHDAVEIRTVLEDILQRYRTTLSHDRRHLLDQFRLLDVARKVVGVGSVGTRAWVLLLAGRDDADPLLLQAKEAEASVLEPFCGPSPYPNAGERVVSGQRLMQASSDIFLGWQETVGVDGVPRHYYVRQLRDGKGSADVATMAPRHLAVYARMCGWTLARAHARSGDRVALASYLGKRDTFERALADFGTAYADRAEAQFRQLREAVHSGRIAVSDAV